MKNDAVSHPFNTKNLTPQLSGLADFKWGQGLHDFIFDLEMNPVFGKNTIKQACPIY
jgi:hypothetical protein